MSYSFRQAATGEEEGGCKMAAKRHYKRQSLRKILLKSFKGVYFQQMFRLLQPSTVLKKDPLNRYFEVPTKN